MIVYLRVNNLSVAFLVQNGLFFLSNERYLSFLIVLRLTIANHAVKIKKVQRLMFIYVY